MAKAVLSLDELGLKYSTDKASSGHDYLKIYERCLAPLREQQIVLIEIGVLDGGSLRMWSEFFPNGSIVGLDVSDKPDFGERIETVKGSQGNIELLTQLGAKHRPTVVIDDGSHLWAHQIVTFQYLFPFVASGGVYICEDIHTSYASLQDTYAVDTTTRPSTFFLDIADRILAGRGETISEWTEPAMYYYKSRIESITILPQAVVIQTRE